MVNFADPEDEETVIGMAEYVLAGINNMEKKLNIANKNLKVSTDSKQTIESALQREKTKNTKLKERLARFSKIVEEVLSEDQKNKVQRRMSGGG